MHRHELKRIVLKVIFTLTDKNFSRIILQLQSF